MEEGQTTTTSRILLSRASLSQRTRSQNTGPFPSRPGTNPYIYDSPFVSRPNSHAIPMLRMYSAIIGLAIRVSVTGSPVGVRMAAKMKISRMAYLILRDRNPAVTAPTRARKKTTVGIWNTTPHASKSLTYRENAG